MTKFHRIGLALAIVAAFISGAIAQSGTIKVTSLAGAFNLPIVTSGPQSARLPLNGGTFVCAASAATVVNSNVDAGSIIWMTLKTVGGTVAQPFVATITPGTGFTVTCGGSDTSTYNYVVVG